MSALNSYVEKLALRTTWTYRASQSTACEPAAWTSLALAAHRRIEEAQRPAEWLARIQQSNGSIGITETEEEPRWPTSLAMLAWAVLDQLTGGSHFSKNVAAAVDWSLDDCGKPAPRSQQIGHNTELVGWSWAAATHSWLEPTCFFVLGLRAAGYGHHPRVREGVKLISDRLLPRGGANYGNTIVLGQEILPHVQPTGLAMLALAGESLVDERISKSLNYLERNLGPHTAPASLAFGCLGLAAQDRSLEDAASWVLASMEGSPREQLAAYEQALLLLAARPALLLDHRPKAPAL
jgi:hypothetical protein